MIKQEIQQLETDAKVDLFVIDLTPIGQPVVFRFYPGVDYNYGDVRFNTFTYTPWPVVIEGFTRSGTGPPARPTLTFSNVTGYFTQQLPAFEDFIGAKILRLRTFAKYLDGYITSDPTAFTQEAFYVDRKKMENKQIIQFELSTAIDFLNKKLPGRIMIANTCPWVYKGTAKHPECTWPGTDPSKWFDRNGNTVATEQEDECGKRLFDCEIRFGTTPNSQTGYVYEDGTTAELPYGGFPTLGRT